ncbi:mesogenin-1 [Xenopus laevis]|uniref:Mesogenin-1 n=3 Tax=Xenopus laevis TaxID=8355 RepID=MSGN1_XENLA|nr:mesogenin-1 [Xenopus laevis]Q9W690.1 RecName: Full=Mesogenin-1; AltName: Full=MesP-related bHLH factor; AltName: Full=Paraxial mesoderm-specific expression and regulatory capacities; AltName: Full=pMesogenin1; Short=pMsgn1 [Xenopus laevis]AAD28545.1 MesP-related bHLH factor [Xenopus laevis]AAF70376.1 pMesogenin1 [Xenopus laevis]AAI69595.1 MesP-related bHLH factor [Xenopus laevis]AAI69599.1 MesP-related bHLH factor [Xenopus laevis]OCT81268.1 hypothetical protein XELAEV_18028085mg [Xenopus l
METLHHPLVKMEEDYALSSDSEPNSTCMANTWDWKSHNESYSLSQTPSPQSVSPAASYESTYSSSPHTGQGLEEMPFSYSLLQYPTLCHGDNGALTKKDHGHKTSMTTHRRRKASEREKLRMRAIAEALHTLRNNLPPMYSQGRQPLTKIQTLKCTINYISELTNLLQCSKRA